MATPGLSVVFAGPGDLRRAYEGDMEQVEAAIQAVLAACKEFDVVCGVTAGVDDIGERLEQGFGMIIVTEPGAVAVGRAAAGRTG
jgi:2-keto-3-deoxy-L-rhamnonate aldolase RhmA